MDVRAQLSRLGPEAREALAQRIRTQLSDADFAAPDHDVTIVGGGVAALTLALEIRSARPHTQISSSSHPLPGARDHPHGRRVDGRDVGALPAGSPGTGRPSADLAASQDGVADVLLARAATPISPRRMELGSSAFIPQVTYQIDRGRLENELNRRCRVGGYRNRLGRVRSVEFGHGDRPHTISRSGRRHNHPDHGALGGRRIGPKPGVAPTT